MRKTIPTAVIRADIDRGMSDEEIMEKYGLTEKGLKRLFENLWKAMSMGLSQIRVESEE